MYHFIYGSKGSVFENYLTLYRNVLWDKLIK